MTNVVQTGDVNMSLADLTNVIDDNVQLMWKALFDKWTSSASKNWQVEAKVSQKK